MMLLAISGTISLSSGQNETGLIIFILIACAFGGIILYGILSKRRALSDRKKMIRAFREHPVIAKNAPVLLHGSAEAPDVVLPTTGEHVAWYALTILSRESTISGTSGTSVRVGGIGLGSEHVTGVVGFRFFITSGDFTVNSGGVPYTVQVSSLLNWFSQGAAMVSSVVGGTITSSGLPATTFDDAIGVSAAHGALDWAFRFSAPMKSSQRKTGGPVRHTTSAYTTVVSVKSTVDSRIQEYMSGINLPQGIIEILTKKGITPEDRTEITVVELFIPLNREVYVFGTFDGDHSIIHADPAVRLSVSYDDLERI